MYIYKYKYININNNNMTDSNINLDNDKDNKIENKQIIKEEEELDSNNNIEDYPIKYLIDSDKELINNELVYKKVDTYINNYNSDEYKSYLKYIGLIYRKFNTKLYKISNNNKQILIHKNKDNSLIVNIKKPKILNVKKIIDDMKITINFERNKLTTEYKKMLLNNNNTTDKTNKFKENKNNFIILLEKYYTYELYLRKINNISINAEYDTILYSSLVKQPNSEIDSNINLLDLKLYRIDKNLINRLNNYDIEKLNTFNEIRELIKSNETNKDLLKEKITNYLDYTEFNNNKKILINEINKQDNIINDIIIEKPKINSKINF